MSKSTYETSAYWSALAEIKADELRAARQQRLHEYLVRMISPEEFEAISREPNARKWSEAPPKPVGYTWVLRPGVTAQLTFEHRESRNDDLLTSCIALQLKARRGPVVPFSQNGAYPQLRSRDYATEVSMTLRHPVILKDTEPISNFELRLLRTSGSCYIHVGPEMGYCFVQGTGQMRRIANRTIPGVFDANTLKTDPRRVANAVREYFFAPRAA